MNRKSTLLFSLLLAVGFSSKATFQPVPVTGFTHDVVANGTGAATTSTSANADGGSPGYAFVGQDFKSTSASALPTYYLPSNGVINSVNTSGVTFQLEDFNNNNALRLTSTSNTGDLTLVSMLHVSDLYVLATAGNGSSVASFTVNFSDATSQTFSGITVADWYNGTGFAKQGIGRVALSNDGQDGTSTNPRLYEIRLTLSTANYNKEVTSITVTKNSGGTTLLVMGLAANAISPCAAPVSQPTSLLLSPTLYKIDGSFTASVPPADKYLVLRTDGAAAPSVAPTNGTTYTSGTILGNAKVIIASSGTTFSDATVIGNTMYTYTVYSYSDATCYDPSQNPTYNIVSPLAATASTPACAPVSAGTYSVGPTGTYPDLTSAVNAIYLAGGATGNVNFELQSTYTSATETFPITIPNVSTGPCATGTPIIKIYPAAGATGLVITSANTTATLDFNGSKNLILDGRPGATGSTSQLKIENTSTAGVAIRLINEASANTVTYCEITGQNTSNTSSGLSGVIYIGGTTGTDGNDNNVISYNNVHATAGGFPAIGISAYGNTTTIAANNDNNAILNNNVYDFFSASIASTGVKVDVGNTAWTVSDNHLYQTATRTYTTSNTHRGLWVTPNTGGLTTSANNFLITNNFIGGTAPNAGGTPYTMTASNATLFMGMDLSMGGGTPTSVQGNVIRNMSLTTTSTTTSGVYIGIGVANGVVNIGTVTGNTIGAGTGTGSIVVTNGSGGTTFGIRLGSGNDITVANNTVGSFTINGTSTTIPANFIGIGTGISNGGATIATITNNLVGSLTTPNSINLATAVTSTGTQTFTGINISNLVTTSTIANNTIANNNNAHVGAGTTSFVKGINVSTSASSITGNTIRNLNTASLATGSGASASVVGISMSSTNTAGCEVSGNVIQSLTLTSSSTSAANRMVGIFYSGTSSFTSIVSKNLIHSFDVTAVNPAVIMTGIDFSAGTASFVNNMIRLGIKPDGSDITAAMTVRGISSNSSSANIWFNSVYIGGTNVGTNTNPSYAFIRTLSSGTYNIRNNIFVNNRSNASTGGKHYCLYFTSVTTGATVNNNLYQYVGTGGYLAYSGTADVATYSPGWIASDVNSITGDPMFINPTGLASTVNLHIASNVSSPIEAAGAEIANVVDDFDGASRASNTPTDIGADAGNFSAITWTGSVSNSWGIAGNWSPSVIPTATDDVVIPTGAANMPAQVVTTRAVSNLIIQPNASINITGDLQISKGLVNNGTTSGTGPLTLNGSATQAINGSGNTANLLLNNSAGATVSSEAGTKFNVTDVLNVTNGTLATNGNVFIKSTAAKTARVAPVTGTISGGVTVERAVSEPSAKRAWRLLTAPLRSTGGDVSIFDTWQLGGVIGSAGTGIGTLITGPAANQATNGLDATSGYSLQSFDGTVLSGVSNTKTTPLFTNAASAANKGYFIFVRGDRSSLNLFNNTKTVLSAKGELQTGDQTFATNASANGMTLLPNPYASPVDFDVLRQDNATSNIKPNFYFWDPNLSTLGGYVTVTYDGSGSNYTITPSGADRTRYIQSGQAVFVQTNATGTGTASVTFKETQKSANTTNNVFREGTQLEKLFVTLGFTNTDGTRITADGIVAKFNNNYSAAVQNEDAQKLFNFDENIAFNRAGNILSVEGRKLVDNSDTLFMHLSNMKVRNYQLTINPENFNAPGLHAYLEDAYLKTKEEISLANETNISFSITNEASSAASDRFRIVFKNKASILPQAIVKNELVISGLYPNPVVEKLNISLLSPKTQAAHVSIINEAGKVVIEKPVQLTQDVNTLELLVKQLPKGIYFLKIINADGTETNAVKFIR